MLKFLAVNLLLFNLAVAQNYNRPLIDGSPYTQASLLVELEPGRRLNLYCIGNGSPVVIFESGLTEPINNWGWVQPTIAKTTMACSYDRAGVGFSDPIVRHSTSENIVDDLHRMLTAAKIKPPYILVGHSTGALSARLYAHTYPDEVVGMVLVDPSDENQLIESRKLNQEQSDEEWQAGIEAFLQSQRDCMNAAKEGFVSGSEKEKRCKFEQYEQLSDSVRKATNNFQMKYPFWQAQVSELESFYFTSAEQLRRARKSLGDMPLMVLTEDRVPPKNIPPEQLKQWKLRYELWKSFHLAQSKLSLNGNHKIIPGAGHHIQLEKPEAVEKAILSVLEDVSKYLRSNSQN